MVMGDGTSYQDTLLPLLVLNNIPSRLVCADYYLISENLTRGSISARPFFPAHCCKPASSDCSDEPQGHER